MLFEEASLRSEPPPLERESSGLLDILSGWELGAARSKVEEWRGWGGGPFSRSKMDVSGMASESTRLGGCSSRGDCEQSVTMDGGQTQVLFEKANECFLCSWDAAVPGARVWRERASDALPRNAAESMLHSRSIGNSGNKQKQL